MNHSKPSRNQTQNPLSSDSVTCALGLHIYTSKYIYLASFLPSCYRLAAPARRRGRFLSQVLKHHGIVNDKGELNVPGPAPLAHTKAHHHHQKAPKGVTHIRHIGQDRGKYSAWQNNNGASCMDESCAAAALLPPP